MAVSELNEDTQDQISDLLENLQQIEKLKNKIENKDLINFSFEKEKFSEINKSPLNLDDYEVNKKVLSDDIKMMHEFIMFKYFKKVMKRNNNIVE